MRGCRFVLILILLPLALFAAPAGTEGVDWSRWRGPNGDGTTPEGDWNPKALDGQPRVAWQARVGVGFSAPVVTADFVYVMGNARGRDTVWCLRARDGGEVWSYSYPCRAGQYAGPLSTPVVDGDVVYTLSREGHLFSFDARRGKILWQKHLVNDYGVVRPEWDLASSVLVYGDRLLINVRQAGMAVNKATGEMIWQTERQASGYASPVLMRAGGRTQALFFGATALYGVDPDSGRILWSYPWTTQFDVNAADPLVFGNRVFLSSNYGRGCVALEITAAGPRRLWQNTAVSSHFSSFIYAGGFIYANDADANAHRGSFKCLDAATGAVRWEAPLGVGSLIAAGGKLILLTERRELVVAEMTPDAYRPIARCQIPGSGLFWTAPVLSRGKLYARGMTGDLVCLDLSR